MSVTAARRSRGSSRSSASVKKRSHAAPVPASLLARHRRDIWVVALTVVAIFAALAEAHALGPFGRGLATGLAATLGVARVLLPIFLFGLAVAMVWGKLEADRPRVVWSVVLALASCTGLADLAGGRPSWTSSTSSLAHGGGWLGVATGGLIAQGIGTVGATVILLAVLVVAVMIATSTGLRSLASVTYRAMRTLAHFVVRWWSARPVKDPNYDHGSLEDEPVPSSRHGVETQDEYDLVTYDEVEPDEEVPENSESDAEDVSDSDRRDDPERELSERAPDVEGTRVAQPTYHWELPPLSLLSRTRDQRHDRAAITTAGRELVDALSAHGVATTLLGFTVGPTVTRYELELGPGVKVSRVTSLNKDIAYAMASPDVRILAPIPGRSAIGVEVPNRQRSLVALGDLLASEEASNASHPLEVPIGRDIAGRTVVVNLAEMPHVLISGATGAGKSSCINSLVTGLVMRSTPEEVRLLLVDPKRVEMGQYNDLPHLLAPVVVDPKRAAGALQWAVKEMERRYDLLAACGARDITSYQQLLARGELQASANDAELVADSLRSAGVDPQEVAPDPEPERLPYIVVVVDELNDLMMVAARDVEESVVRIAQMARAVGIHLVLATQRPSVDVITGVIKANIPSRMAFAVSSLADSRVILDQAGAERLIGKGDMLMVTASSNVARRIQSPWVSEEEVRRVVENWRSQGGQPESVVALDEPVRSSSSGASSDDEDELLAQARHWVITTQSGSTSMLQRKLRVGFARAGRLMDELEQEGVVAPGDGSKARKVLITPEEYGSRDPE